MAAPFFILRMMAVLDTSGVTAGIANIQRQVAGAGAGMGGAGAVAGVAAVGVAAGMLKATDAAIQWEDQMAGVKRVIGDTGKPLNEQHDDFMRMQDDLRNVTKQVPITHGEVANMAQTAAALGVPEDAIAEFSRVAGTLSMLSDDLSPEQTAANMGKIRQVFNLGVDDLNNFGSALTALGVSGASTEGEILAMTQMASGAIGLFGGGVEDVMAFAAAFSNVGVQSEAGGSAIQKMFLNAGMAISEGNKHLAKFAELAHMTQAEFAIMFRSDPAAAITEVVKGMAAAEDPLEALRSVGINQARWTRGWGAVIKAEQSTAKIQGTISDNMAEANEKILDENFFEDMAKTRFDTMATDITLMTSALHDLGITVGTAIIPWIRPVVQGFTAFVEGINNLLKAVPALNAVLSPLIFLLSSIVAIRFGNRLLSMLLPMGPVGTLLANSWTGVIDTGILAPITRRLSLLKGIVSAKIIESMVGASAAAQLGGMTVGSAILTGIQNRIRTSGKQMIAGAIVLAAGEAARQSGGAEGQMGGVIANTIGGALMLGVPGAIIGASASVIMSIGDITAKATADVDAKAAEWVKTATDAQLRASLENLKTITKDVGGVTEAFYGLSDITQGTVFSGLFGNAAETTEAKIAQIEQELKARMEGMGSNIAQADPGASEIAAMMDELGLGVEEGADGVVHSIQTAQSDILSAWDTLSEKIAEPPKNISFAKRLKIAQAGIRQSFKEMKRSIQADDPINAAMWHQRLIAQRKAMNTLRTEAANTLGMAERRWRDHRARVKAKQDLVKTDVKSTQTTITEKMNTAAASVATSGTLMDTALRQVDLYDDGVRIGESLANGLNASMAAVELAAAGLAAKASAHLAVDSPSPKTGPLHGIEKSWPKMITAWLKPIKRFHGKASFAARGLADAATPRPRLGAVGVGAMHGVGMRRGGERHNHYHVGTLIANDKGIDELDDRIERRRKHRRRGANRHANDAN